MFYQTVLQNLFQVFNQLCPIMFISCTPYGIMFMMFQLLLSWFAANEEHFGNKQSTSRINTLPSHTSSHPLCDITNKECKIYVYLTYTECWYQYQTMYLLKFLPFITDVPRHRNTFNESFSQISSIQAKMTQMNPTGGIHLSSSQINLSVITDMKGTKRIFDKLNHICFNVISITHCILNLNSQYFVVFCKTWNRDIKNTWT